MIAFVVLNEYEEQLVDLSPVDVAFIATRLGGRITIRRTLSGSGFLLNPRQFVGLVKLPSGLHLECRPKVPIGNLFYLLALAYDLPDPLLDLPAEVDRLDDIFTFVASRFAALVEERIDHGLYRAYIDAEDNLATVRGRIVITDDIRLNHILRHRTYCRFSDYSWDVSENQVVRQVVRLLVSWGFPPALRTRLQNLDTALAEVTPGRFVSSDLDQFSYHRLNEAYQPVHQLCRLFLDASSPSERRGSFAFQSFFVDMNRLFESAITRVLVDLAPSGVTVVAQSTRYLDHAAKVPIRPDILVRRRGLAPVVIDCKYKRLLPGDHRNNDLYQLVSYATALNVRTAFLIYPRHLATIDSSFSIKNSEIAIHESTVDLSGSPIEFRDSCNQLGALIF